MSKKYMKDGTIVTEHDYLDDNQRKGTVSRSVANRAIKIARMRGIILASKWAGCFGTEDNTKQSLKVYLNNINKRAAKGQP